jgi:hypothetical protein
VTLPSPPPVPGEWGAQLPPPTAPPAPSPVAPAAYEPEPLRPGQLTPGWKMVLVCGWVGVILGFAAVWKSSWTLGFSTWWLGPESEPRFVGLLILPFVLPLAMVVLALANVRYAAFAGIVAALVTAAIGWGDIGRQDKFAAVELALAGAGFLISVACLAGLVRRPAAGADPAPAPALPAI